ncbi:MAG: diguanylate phosphodiesterase [Rhizobacter sp.]|nr:diguanylate phosphodiesterase [Rhizobacter sp.]
MVNLNSSYDAGVVAASVVVATFASYVALDLAKRVRSEERDIVVAWWIAGSLTLGTGIWSMHFLGMLAFSLPIQLGYGGPLTALSWSSAVAASAVALYVASQGSLNAKRLAGGSAAMAGGICAMHYIGMAAMDMQPGIVWNYALVAASVAVALAASAAALLIFFWLRTVSARYGLRCQALAAVVMGLAISGMHYTGMAAASFPAGSVCGSAGSLSGSNLGMLSGGSAVLLLTITFFTSLLDARMQRKAHRLAVSLKVANAELQAANAELQKRAFLDPLTALPNRLLFENRLMHAVARRERSEAGVAVREQDKLALLFIDVDGFKPVNDSFGHAVGDTVLKEVAMRLGATVREHDTVARIGGDEFLVLMEGVQNTADPAAMAKRVVEAIRQPFDVMGRMVRIGASVGVVLYPDHGHHDSLIGHADAAMYVAKQAGGNRFTVFEPHMDAGAADQLSLQSDLSMAVEANQLALHYQPKIDGLTGKIRGVEALLRWKHPVRGMIGPDVFIPMAERFGLINELGNWVIEEACRQMRRWADDGVRMRVAINLSAHQLREADLVERIREALHRYQVQPSQLLCEITESVAMDDLAASQRAFSGLAQIGVFLSIDDFGTGHSSLSYLRQLPARQIKIDRSFVRDLDSSDDARAVVDAVIHLAHALGLRVVAEGVETQSQRDILLSLQCDELQGFLFARPMSASTLSEWTLGQGPADAAEFSASVLDDLMQVA